LTFIRALQIHRIEASFAKVDQLITVSKFAAGFLTPVMASKKQEKFCICNHLVNFGKLEASIEALFDEVGQVIAGKKSRSFLTPDMASKNDARHGIVLSIVGTTRCHVWHRFLKPCLASKSCQTLSR